MFAFLATAIMLAAGMPAPSPTPPPEIAALDRLFTAKTVSADWFTPEFLAQAPLSQLQTIVDSVHAQLGAYKESKPVGAGGFTSIFDKGSVPVDVRLDAQGRFAGLFLHPPVLNNQPTPKPGAITPRDALARLFTAKAVSADWFTPEFLQQIPAANVQELIDGYRTGFGAFQRVDQSGNNFTVVFAHGTLPALIALDAQGRIAGLRFLKAPPSQPVSLRSAVDQIKALPGRAALLVIKGNRVLANYRADAPMAVGSAFKLAVLNGLQDQVNVGSRRWSDVVALKHAWKSLPSGMLQDWPDGSALTIQTLATLMISISDNTAADSLVNIVGRSAIEPHAPHSRPFLTTRETFILQSKRNATLRARYLHADVAGKRAILRTVDAMPAPTFSDVGTATQALVIEDFFTVRELCGLIGRVAALPLMSVNPGVANADEWARVAFKGGSQDGVLNLTTWLKAKNGNTYCVSATWNNTASLDESRFEKLYGGIVAGLAR